MLRPALSLAILGTLGTAVISGLAAAWLFDLSTLEGLLLGAIISSTDGAAIFALLRGSTLRRRLARTLEGEAGLQRPGRGAARDRLHRLDPAARLRRRSTWLVLFVARDGHRRGGGHRASAGCAVQALRRTRLRQRRAVPGRHAVRGRRSPSAARRRCTARASSPSTSPGWCSARRRIPAQADGDRVPRGARLGGADRDVPRARPARLPERSSTTCGVEGTVLALVLVFVARPVSTLRSRPRFDGFTARERIVLGWAGLRGAVPVVLATFPVIENVPEARAHEFFNIVFFAVVISTLLQGSTFESLAGRLGVTTERAGAAAAARRDRHGPAARRRDRGVPGGPGRRDRRPARARARPPARRAASA